MIESIRIYQKKYFQNKFQFFKKSLEKSNPETNEN